VVVVVVAAAVVFVVGLLHCITQWIYIYYPTFGIMCLKCGMITSNMKILTTTHHGVSRISSENSASFDTELRCLWLFPSLTGLRRRHLEAEALVIF
jgi:hypothetical protein